MPRIASPLTDTKVKAKYTGRPKRLTDGSSGLCLQITQHSRRWQGRYRNAEGKEQTYSIGPYPDISLKDARILWADAKKLGDPNQAKRDAKAAKGKAAANTLETVARKWHGNYLLTGNKGKPLTAKHGGEILHSLENHIFPILGSSPIDSIRLTDLAEILLPLAAEKSETAHRVLHRLNKIYHYAIKYELTERNPTINLCEDMASREAVNMARMPVEEIPAFKQKLDAYSGAPETRLAILLTILTACRTKEVIEARWEEIQGDVWVIPAERMKMRKEHALPLSTAAQEVSEELRPLTSDTEYLFPNRVRNPKNPCMSNNSMLQALIRMGYGKHGGCHATMHGFRSVFSTWANGSGQPWTVDAIEKQLAHGEPDASRDAYNDNVKFKERRYMMDEYAKWFDNLA